MVDTNLGGTLNCLEFARRRAGGLIFLSSSRVYAIGALRNLPLIETATRLTLADKTGGPGLSGAGIAPGFPSTDAGPRSLYGTTKLASEMLVQEMAADADFPCLINRCGVIAGPGQFGKVDQGVYTLWVARHVFGGALSYTGFGGAGKQVRDLLHPSDLARLVQRQLACLDQSRGEVYAVGGGADGAVSLCEYTALCRETTGRHIEIGGVAETSAVDIPWYVSDYSVAADQFDWRPTIGPGAIVADIHAWLCEHRDALQPLFSV
jgi:CDP-paratose 2-epimerase